MTPLLPLYVNPLTHPDAWDAVAAAPVPVSAIVDVSRGPGDGLDPVYLAAIPRLVMAGVTVLGYVDLAGGTRPVAGIRTEVGRWAGYRVAGVFFDRSPAGRFGIGTVAAAVRAARRVGLGPLVLSGGRAPDPEYRELGATVVSFEGSALRYRDWLGEDGRPGDAHLVHGVPAAERAGIERLARERGAGYLLVTDREPPNPYAYPPAWCCLAPVG